ncbi:hypothetical protein QJS04_geneDACA023531 [Acorus gramineus]|uniref:Uncharacterized protein n=1 Tax=Acorus gramineus TaxID=55184 RepID=A0AAV9BAS5_ACOGR|nr:hypothetical protein QJS04_geneDACA023531 [Acorus gramineus]
MLKDKRRSPLTYTLANALLHRHCFDSYAYNTYFTTFHQKKGTLAHTQTSTYNYQVKI